MHALIDAAIEAMAPQYPELKTEADRIHTVADAEEAAFGRTLRAAPRSWTTRWLDTEAVRRRACCPASRPSRCTTPTASRST